MIGAETQINGRSLRLINTHLQAFFMINASSNDHHTQRDRVELELRRCTEAALLGGDFNCALGESLIEQFKRAGFRPSQNAKVTWRRMPFVVDHIFYRCLATRGVQRHPHQGFRPSRRPFPLSFAA